MKDLQQIAFTDLENDEIYLLALTNANYNEFPLDLKTATGAEIREFILTPALIRLLQELYIIKFLIMKILDLSKLFKYKILFLTSMHRILLCLLIWLLYLAII